MMNDGLCLSAVVCSRNFSETFITYYFIFSVADTFYIRLESSLPLDILQYYIQCSLISDQKLEIYKVWSYGGALRTVSTYMQLPQLTQPISFFTLPASLCHDM